MSPTGKLALSTSSILTRNRKSKSHTSRGADCSGHVGTACTYSTVPSNQITYRHNWYSVCTVPYSVLVCILFRFSSMSHSMQRVAVLIYIVHMYNI